MDDTVRKDKPILMEKFDGWLFNLIKRDYPDDPEDRIKEFIELNSQALFTETLIKFRWASRADLDEAKEKVNVELKKLTGDV